MLHRGSLLYKIPMTELEPIGAWLTPGAGILNVLYRPRLLKAIDSLSGAASSLKHSRKSGVKSRSFSSEVVLFSFLGELSWVFVKFMHQGVEDGSIASPQPALANAQKGRLAYQLPIACRPTMLRSEYSVPRFRWDCRILNPSIGMNHMNVNREERHSI